MTDDERRLPVEHQAAGPLPAVVRSSVGGHDVTDICTVVTINERTLTIEVDDAAVALAISLAPVVEVDVDDGTSVQTIVAEPGSRADDNPTSRRVELVRRDPA